MGHWPRRVLACGLVMGMLAALSTRLASAQPIGAFGGPGGPPATVTRVAGPDRYATSAALSAATFPPGVPVAYVASGADFADALAVGPVAGRAGAPILTVPTDGIPASVAAELDRLHPGRIVVVGGTAAVSAAVEQALGEFTEGGVTRIAGADRYATAAAVSAATFAPGVSELFLASGEDFPDALAAGPVAAAASAPILLTERSQVPAVTVAEVARLRPQLIVVLGGSSAITPASLNGKLGPPGMAVVRAAGPDRYQTAVDVAQLANQGSNSPAFLVSGVNFADALAAVPAAARSVSPLLLSRPDCVPSPVLSALGSPVARNVVVVGGSSALGSGVAALRSCPGTTTPTITVTPHTNVGAGDTVTVTGRGFPTGRQLEVLECNIDPAIPRDGSGCDLRDAMGSGANPDGTVGPVQLKLRTGVIGANPLSSCPPTASQVKAGVRCAVVIATLDAAVTAAQPLTFRPSPPPPVVSATPTSGLRDGETITVSGADFPTGRVSISECSGPVTASSPVLPLPGLPPGASFPPVCNGRSTTTAMADAAGHFGPVAVTVYAGRFGSGTGYGAAAACPPTREQQLEGVTGCVLEVSASDGTMLASAALSFTQTQTGPSQPAVAVTPATGLHDGDTVVVTATGFAPYMPVSVEECSPVPSGSGYQGDGCGFVNGPGLVLTTDENGAIGPVTLPVHVLAFTDLGSTGASVLACPPSPSQQQAGIAACVIDVSAADGITSGAATPIAFAAGVTAPVPTPAPVVTSSPVVIDQIVDPGDLTPDTGEHVVLRNTDPKNPADVSNWSIQDLAGNLLLIGPGYTIAPGGILSVYTGTGTDTPTSYYNGITVALLNQPVEELTLLTDSGQPVAWYTDVEAPS